MSSRKKEETNNENLLAIEGLIDNSDSVDFITDYVDVDGFETIISNALTESKLNCARKVCMGKITQINKDKSFVVIDVGLKSEGIVPISEFFQSGELESLAIGKEVLVYIENLDTRTGGVSLSRSKAVREEAWNGLVAAKNNDSTMEGIAFSRVKGGVAVDFSGIIAFLPGSQIDVRPVKDISDIVGKRLPYKVLTIEPKSRSVIVSRKAILESSRDGVRDKFLESIQEGDILDGIVKNITNYGVFVDLGDVDGLLHVTDISWNKISHPSEVLVMGQKIRVKIVKYDKETRRLSLGMKQLTDNPWMQMKEILQPGKLTTGKIANITPYGVFVEIAPGIEGLLHISEMSWAKDSYKKYKSMQVGQDVEVAILEVDLTKHRIALSMRHTTDNPWEKFATEHNTGEILNGVVRNVTDFGIFVGVDNSDIDGLVHISDLSWGGDSLAEISKYKKDDVIQVVYLGSDLANQRIRFGVKQLSDDPFDQHKQKIVKDQTVTCTVVGIKPDGIEVEIFGAIRSFIKKSNLAREKIEQRVDRVVIGDRIDAKVVNYDEESRKVTLSVRALEEDEYEKIMQQYGSVDTGATIGSILGEAMQLQALNLQKEKVESQELGSESSENNHNTTKD